MDDHDNLYSHAELKKKLSKAQQIAATYELTVPIY